MIFRGVLQSFALPLVRPAMSRVMGCDVLAKQSELQHLVSPSSSRSSPDYLDTCTARDNADFDETPRDQELRAIMPQSGTWGTGTKICVAVGLLCAAAWCTPGWRDSDVKLPGDAALAPRDMPIGMSCPTHGVVHFIRRLAGPWGLPISMDGRRSPRHHRNLFARHNPEGRSAVRRIVVYYDLNYPQNTFCKARSALDAHGGSDVHVLTVGFPTIFKPRGFGYKRKRRCAPKWRADNLWLMNQNASAKHSSLCKTSAVTPTPCELLLGLVDRLRNTSDFPNLEAIRVIGFSAGGQLLDKCMYSQSRFPLTAPKYGGPDVKFLIISPGALFYPVTERAILPSLPELTCDYFGPKDTLKRSYEFRRPQAHFRDIANMTQAAGWYCVLPKNPAHLTWPMSSQKRMCEKRSKKHQDHVYKFTAGDAKLAPGCRHKGKDCMCCRQHKDQAFQQRHACQNFDHYRYGLHGKTPPDMPKGSSCNHDACAPELRDRIRAALLERTAVYIGGSADVCNWALQSRPEFQPKCGWCTEDRTEFVDKSTKKVQFARDAISPIVDSCRAMWEGFTRFERMKIFKEVIQKVVAPRVGIEAELLASTRQFWTLVGAGHSDNTVINMLAPCLARDDCYNVSRLVPMDQYDSGEEEVKAKAGFLGLPNLAPPTLPKQVHV